MKIAPTVSYQNLNSLDPKTIITTMGVLETWYSRYIGLEVQHYLLFSRADK